jgi:cobalt/nickel transport system permease protein
VLIEQSAYTNRWRRVSPAAKGLFSLCGLVAAYVAATPATACGIAAVLCAVTILGARIPPVRYLRVAAPALLFLFVSAMSLAVSLKIGGSVSDVALHIAQTEYARVAQVCGRSLGGLAALLLLALTTPLSDIIALLRRLKAPEVLLDIMVIGYRTLFIFSEAAHDTITAQASRLGYVTTRCSMRSLGSLVANITVQVWQRSHALHLAAMTRNNDGPLRFLEHSYPSSTRDLCIALSAGTLLVALSMVII